MIERIIRTLRYKPEAILIDMQPIAEGVKLPCEEIARILETQAYRLPFENQQPHAFLYRATRKRTGEQMLVSGLSLLRDRWSPRSKFQNTIRAWRTLIRTTDLALLPQSIGDRPTRVVLDDVSRGLTKLLTRDMPRKT